MIQGLTIALITLAVAAFGATLPGQSLTESIKRGKEVYALYCQACHMEDGKGTPGINPPLARADYLRKPARTLIGIILNGQSGDVIVNGKKYNTMMPAQSYLTDQQIADVLNYARNSWGNKIAGNITPSMVKPLR